MYRLSFFPVGVLFSRVLPCALRLFSRVLPGALRTSLRQAPGAEPKRVFTGTVTKAAEHTFQALSEHFPQTVPKPPAIGLRLQISASSIQPCPPFRAKR